MQRTVAVPRLYPASHGRAPITAGMAVHNTRGVNEGTTDVSIPIVGQLPALSIRNKGIHFSIASFYLFVRKVEEGKSERLSAVL